MKEPIADTEPLAPFEFGPFGRMLAPVTKWMAIAGGLVFVALVIMSIISIYAEMLGESPPRIDERTDVYLVGATLYEIVAGKPPHDGRSFVEMMQHIVRSFDPCMVCTVH